MKHTGLGCRWPSNPGSATFLAKRPLSHSFLIVEFGMTVRSEAAARKSVSPQHNVVHTVGTQEGVTAITTVLESTCVWLSQSIECQGAHLNQIWRREGEMESGGKSVRRTHRSPLTPGLLRM